MDQQLHGITITTLAAVAYHVSNPRLEWNHVYGLTVPSGILWWMNMLPLLPSITRKSLSRYSHVQYPTPSGLKGKVYLPISSSFKTSA